MLSFHPFTLFRFPFHPFILFRFLFQSFTLFRFPFQSRTWIPYFFRLFEQRFVPFEWLVIYVLFSSIILGTVQTRVCLVQTSSVEV
jgi:hypothetical protein